MSPRSTILMACLALMVVVAGRSDAQVAAPQSPAGALSGGPAGGLAGEAQPPWLRGALARVNAAQRQLNQGLSRELRRLRGGEVTGAALGVAWIAFFYGVLHAIGPGHGKLVVSSLFLARDVRLRTALGISWLVSVLQTVSSITIVTVVAFALGRGGFNALHDSRRVELICYGLITLIGVSMLIEALREGWVHRRHAESGSSRQGEGVAWGGLVLATGLTPCASAIIILLFALGQGLYLVGVAASLVMAVGMGLTVSMVGLAAVAVRRGTLRAAAPTSATAYWAKTLLGVAGAAAIAGLGLVLFLSAWTSV
jgi:nickel/cobalt transporter (NicO) family protein